MVALLYRPLVIGLPIALVACTNSVPTVAEQDTAVPLGIDLGSSGPVAAEPEHQAQSHGTPASEGRAAHPQNGSEMRMAHEGANDAHGSGTVNSVDPAQHKVNLSHNPIPEIGWPAMTMEFPVAPSIDLRTLKPGTRVNFTIERGEGGMYESGRLRRREVADEPPPFHAGRGRCAFGYPLPAAARVSRAKSRARPQRN